MSKKRHKSKSSDEANNINNRQNNNNNPFGINPNQLLSMFGNIDMNQINSMLQSMNTEGFDFNNFNLGSLQNLMSGMNRPQNLNPNINQNQQAFKGSGINKQNSNEKRDYSNYEDENIQMLLSLKRIVNEERVAFIDKIIKLYEDGAFED